MSSSSHFLLSDLSENTVVFLCAFLLPRISLLLAFLGSWDQDRAEATWLSRALLPGPVAVCSRLCPHFTVSVVVDDLGFSDALSISGL